MEGQHHVIVGRLVQCQCTPLDQVVGEFEDMLRYRVFRVQEVKGAGQGIQEAVGNPPGMATLTHNEALDAQVEGGFADTQRHLAHVFIAADEHAEICGLAGMGTQGPADAGFVKHLGIAYQSIDVRLGKEVSGWRDNQNFRTFLIQREPYLDAGVVLNIFFQTLQGICQGRLGQAEVVSNLVHLGNNLVAIFLPDTHGIHDLARGHGDFSGIDSVGTKYGTAAALGTLVKVTVPVIQHLLCQVNGADQLGEVFAGKGKVAAIYLAQQILAGDRHVFRIAGAQVVVTLVGAGTALDTGIEEHPESPVLASQFLHLVQGDLFPIVDQFTRESQVFLEFFLGDIGLAVRHYPFLDMRNDGVFLEFRCVEVSHA